MKIKELISHLKTFDPEIEIGFTNIFGNIVELWKSDIYIYEKGNCLLQKDNILEMSTTDKCDRHCLSNKTEFKLQDVSKEELLKKRIDSYNYLL